MSFKSSPVVPGIPMPPMGVAYPPYLAPHVIMPSLPPPVPHVIQEGPSVTVFIGNISDSTHDSTIRQLLIACGRVLHWKRVQGASGRLQAFGFCEYANPDSGLRAMRVLHNCFIHDKNLVVKVDAKTEGVLERFKQERRSKINGGMGAAGTTEELNYVDANMEMEDNLARERIAIALNDHKDMMKNIHAPKETSRQDKVDPRWTNDERRSGPAGSLNDVEMDDGKRKIINTEIEKFRETMKIREAEKENEKKKNEEEDSIIVVSTRRSKSTSVVRCSNSRSPSYSRRSRRRSRSPRRSRSRERKYRTRCERDSKDRDQYSQERSKSSRYNRRSSERDYRVESPTVRRSLTARDREIEQELKENAEAERKVRKQEAAYQDMLFKWESREQKMANKRAKEAEREKMRLDDIEKEARKLRVFLEDYDDEKDDKHFYRGRELERRLAEREIEAMADAEDRSCARREMDDLRSHISAGVTNMDERMNKINGDFSTKIPGSGLSVVSPANAQLGMDTDATSDEVVHIHSHSPITPKPVPKPTVVSPETNKSVESNSNSCLFEEVTKRKRLSDMPISNLLEEKVTKKLPPTKVNDATTNEDKRRNVKSLIDKIPTEKEALFDFNIDWDLVDENLIERRIRPWVNKKIAEYIGEPEPTLTDFICSKVLAGCAAKAILEDVGMVLDEEAEVFVVKMWRLLIFELENKKQKSARPPVS